MFHIIKASQNLAGRQEKKLTSPGEVNFADFFSLTRNKELICDGLYISVHLCNFPLRKGPFLVLKAPYKHISSRLGFKALVEKIAINFISCTFSWFTRAGAEKQNYANSFH